ncbi:ABC transporter permease [Haliovirga abyssi]|uniref:Macrolide ABC transporter permease n=1 Tax=Haliovirga abyssi TaxID=2996794 RepID=A0AAU9D4D9_9FUSO|nr:ABC transporter permease [Haliovirga abyssi]BDU50824.1 macrolide ABC transporter permease [Haliovirga abyssi]
MKLSEAGISAIKSVFANKMRSFLTMLGIIIGISSVIMLTSVGRGFQDGISGELTKMGSNMFSLYINYNENVREKDLLRMVDKNIILENPQILNVSSVYGYWGGEVINNLKKKNKKKANLQLLGVDSDYFKVNKATLLYGRLLNKDDNINRRRVAVVDNTLGKKVFGRANIVGEFVKVKTERGIQKYIVVGVIKNPMEKFMTLFKQESFSIITPIKTAHSLFKTNSVEYFEISSKNPKNIAQSAKNTIKILERVHRNKNVYIVENVSKYLNNFNKILFGITAFITFVASIALFVGGIGVMNIMLVTVTERTREIGIRKSLGAKKRDILIQFLIEAVILTLIGGGIGIAFGYGGGVLAAHFLKITPKLSLQMLIIAFAVSSSIGIIFGVYPAKKAADLNPIEALRYE